MTGGTPPIPELENLDMLAAEYVAGVLDESKRKKCRALLQTEPRFAESVASWERRLSALNEDFSEKDVPDSVKEMLDRRLFDDNPADYD